ncbi:uncharacterized protein LOC119165622 [Rhipicephalus microplus]|uniref:uncharacterized protein LOC119165622 n=1 Tax=Rhipicephalus microplus TaxID=6941 RepID=UPI003F6CECD3
MRLQPKFVCPSSRSSTTFTVLATRPEHGGPRAMHQLCDSVSGANWRPMRFEDELTSIRYACCVCHVIPCTMVLLPCSHILCEQCVTGCVIQDGGSVCPLDAQPFCEDERQKLKLPAKTKQNMKAHCWNEVNGCQFVGTIEAVLQHFDRDCIFHALQCRRCERRILRTDIAAHYISGCSQNASGARDGQPSTEDRAFASCYEDAVLEKLSALQRQMNDLSRKADSVDFEAVSCGMKGIETNIASMITRHLKAGLEEVKLLVRNLISDQLSSLQSQMNELVEQTRQHDTSEIQEVVRETTDSQNELKQDVQAMSQLMARMPSDVESTFKEILTVQLREFKQALEAWKCEMKEQMSEVEAYLCTKLMDQQQCRQRALDSDNNGSTETEELLAAAALGKEEIPLNMQESSIPLQLEMFVHETMKTMEFLRQQVYRQREELWVYNITACRDTHDGLWRNIPQHTSFTVILKKAGSIFSAEKNVLTVANLVKYRDMHIQITFESSCSPNRGYS